MYIPKLTCRCRISTFRSICDEISQYFTPDDVIFLQNLHLYHFLTLPTTPQDIPIIYGLLSYWNVEEQAFDMGGHLLKFTADDVALLIGLPNHGEEVKWSRDPLSRFSSIDCKNKIKNFKPSATQDEDNTLSILFVQFLLTNLLFPYNNYTVPKDLLYYSKNLEQFTSYNWAHAVWNFLLQQFDGISLKIKTKKPVGYISGFAPLLSYWFLEHTTLIPPYANKRRPRIMRWEVRKFWNHMEFAHILSKLKSDQVLDTFIEIYSDEIQLMAEGSKSDSLHLVVYHSLHHSPPSSPPSQSPLQPPSPPPPRSSLQPPLQPPSSPLPQPPLQPPPPPPPPSPSDSYTSFIAELINTKFSVIEDLFNEKFSFIEDLINEKFSKVQTDIDFLKQKHIEMDNRRSFEDMDVAEDGEEIITATHKNVSIPFIDSAAPTVSSCYEILMNKNAKKRVTQESIARGVKNRNKRAKKIMPSSFTTGKKTYTIVQKSNAEIIHLDAGSTPKKCIKFNTDQTQDVKETEKHNNIFFNLMARGPDVDIAEIAGKDSQDEARANSERTAKELADTKKELAETKGELTASASSEKLHITEIAEMKKRLDQGQASTSKELGPEELVRKF